jgi:hypothetical protein
MRRFLTLISLLCLAIPAGVSISGCSRDPGYDYCNGLGYGMKTSDVASITLQPATTGISMAFGQTRNITTPAAINCKGASVTVSTYYFGTSNNQLVDISPNGNMCAGTWNRNSGGGIGSYTICNPPDPVPSTGGLPYSVVYITASAQSIVSNPVPVFVHIPATSVSLITTPSSGTAGQQCYSQGTSAVLDAQVCYAGAGNQQYLLCAPSSVTSANSACPMPPTVTPNIIANGTFTAAPASTGNLVAAAYTSGGSVTGSAGQTCVVNNFNNSPGATALVYLTGTNAIATGTALSLTAEGSGATQPSTTATLSSGSATCSGSAVITSSLGPISGSAGQSCNLTLFNNGSAGATATVALTGANTIAPGAPLVITSGGTGATAPPTTAQLTSGTAACSGTASVATTLTPIPSCSAAVGVLSYSVNNAPIAAINSNTITNQAIISAQLPGTTAITASLSTSGSSAGFFSTCPPKAISLTLANGEKVGTITQGVTQNLVTSVHDTNLALCPVTSTNPTGGCPITGLSLTYQSTDTVDISVSSSGAVSTNFPGVASVYALCEPSGCNPAPIYEAGLFGTGLPISSNAVTITTPGTDTDYLWFAAPGQSQYVIPVDLLTGTVGSAARLPYVPNSMVMDPGGNAIYFGSPHEMITFYTASGSVASQNINAPGVVLAVSPDGTTVLVNDQERDIFYLVNGTSNSTTSFGGLGNAAVWTPDSQTLYITDNALLNDSSQGISGHTDTLYVYNKNTGWVTYPLPPSPLSNSLPPGVLPPQVPYSLPANTLSPNVALSSTVQTPAIVIPSVGAYLRGAPTVAHTWCPDGKVGDYNSMFFYPGPDQTADSTVDNLVNVQSDVLTATTDGQHILSASATNGVLSLADLNDTIPALNCQAPNDPLLLGDTLSPLVLQNQLNTTQLAPAASVGSLYATAVNRIIASPASNLAFITYTALESNTNALLPYYQPNTTDPSQPGTVGYVPLTTQKGGTSPSAPLAGIFTPDNKLFFVSTAGDNMVHIISIPTSVTPATPPTDTQQISPNLPACTPVSMGGNDLGCTFTGSGSVVPATSIAIKPRSIT